MSSLVISETLKNFSFRRHQSDWSPAVFLRPHRQYYLDVDDIFEKKNRVSILYFSCSKT